MKNTNHKLLANKGFTQSGETRTDEEGDVKLCPVWCPQEEDEYWEVTVADPLGAEVRFNFWDEDKAVQFAVLASEGLL